MEYTAHGPYHSDAIAGFCTRKERLGFGSSGKHELFFVCLFVCLFFVFWVFFVFFSNTLSVIETFGDSSTENYFCYVLFRV